jgi:hypothetical protein
MIELRLCRGLSYRSLRPISSDIDEASPHNRHSGNIFHISPGAPEAFFVNNYVWGALRSLP